MKLINASQLRNVAAAGLHTGLLASALAAAAMIGGAHAAETRGGVAGKVAYCLDCHGAAGQGYRGYYPMPRLAGQQPEYLKNQLQAFVEHRRTNNIMFNVAHSLSPTMIAALAEEFRALDPRPLAADQRAWSRLVKEFSKTAFPTPMSPPARPAMGPTRKAPGKFPGLRGNCLITRSTSWSTGARNAAKTLQSPIRRRSCRRWRTA